MARTCYNFNKLLFTLVTCVVDMSASHRRALFMFQKIYACYVEGEV